jgi:dihydroorotate dehydrogenase (NAD+) catalytic subunit
MDEMQLDFSKPKFDLEISSPLMNAAGTLGFAPQADNLINFERFGAFVTNPISPHSRSPARNRMCKTYPGGFLLHSGYPNPGLNAVIRQYATRWARSTLPIIAHLLVGQADEVGSMISSLEGLDGVIGFELGLPPQCAPCQAAEFVRAAVGELPIIVRVPLEKAGEFARELVESPLAAISFAPPRGAILDQQGLPVHGRMFGPAVFPFTLAITQEVIGIGLQVIAGGGVYQQSQVDALLEMGALGVQLDSFLWSLGELGEGDQSV